MILRVEAKTLPLKGFFYLIGLTMVTMVTKIIINGFDKASRIS